MNTNGIVVSPSKRKRPEDDSSRNFVDAYNRNGPFHEISAKDAQISPLKRTCSNLCNESQATILSSIERLPYETFLHITSYLGPSTSLTSMACVNRRYNRFLTRIGDIMLRKARRCFRHPPLLPLASPNDGTDTTHKESSISIFVRYSSHCSHIHHRLEILRNLLLLGDNKDACATRQDCGGRPAKRFRKTVEPPTTKNHGPCIAAACSSAKPSISSHNVDKALEIATDLLTELSNSMSFPEHHISCSYALEARILATAGKVGGVVYKHSKGTLEMLEHEMILGNGAGGDVYSEEDNDRNLDDSVSKEIQKQISLDMERIDRARVLMQKVMFHKLLLENKYE